MVLTSYTTEYFRKLKADLDHLDIDALSKVIEMLMQARDKERQIFIFCLH